MNGREKYTMEYLLTLSPETLKDFYDQLSAEIDRRLMIEHPETVKEADEWLKKLLTSEKE